MDTNNDDNNLTGNRPDTRRYEVQDNSGHLEGSRQQGSSSEASEAERLKDENDQSELNKLDDRGTVGGNEAS
ncbi:hypothetical protein [Aridibaculum aurantiacum]|uniref:hypothetical protein n=1 Tax=Aridibaculum aurantiacum TaxID=2810307 RepID=UPI001A972252|nr:hypothetical protein [Aridibaculum aurantiacum]